MTASNQNFEHFAATSRTLRFPLFYGGGGMRPFDREITEARWQLARHPSDAPDQVLIDKPLGSGLVLTGEPDAPVIEVHLSIADTSLSPGGLTTGLYYHQLWVAWAANEGSIAAKGSCKLLPRLGHSLTA